MLWTVSRQCIKKKIGTLSRHHKGTDCDSGWQKQHCTRQHGQKQVFASACDVPSTSDLWPFPPDTAMPLLHNGVVKKKRALFLFFII